MSVVQRILFLGLDGGTAVMLRSAFDRGWMPNLAAFWSGAAAGSLASTQPMITPVAWTSFSTGCTPPVHGIHDFHSFDRRSRAIRSNHPGRVRVPTLWRLLSDAGCDVVTLNLPLSDASAQIRGLVVRGAEAPTFESAFAQCPDFAAEIRHQVPGFTHKLAWKRRPRTLEELRREADRCSRIFLAQAAAALRAHARVDWTALLVHFHNLDSLQHRLWPYLELDETAAGKPDWTAAVVRCLRALDDALGTLLELASRCGAAVIVASDHGFGPCRALVDVNGLLRDAGLQHGRLYGTRFRYRAIRLAERFRRWQARRHGLDPAPASSRPLEGQLGCDWSRTLAFAPFGQLYGAIFLNTELLPSEAAADRVCRQAMDLLRSARDPVRGDPLFCDVYSVADRYGLDPAAEGLPDILALSADGYQAQAKWPLRIVHRRVRPDWNLPATHWSEGVVAIQAPGIQPQTRLNAQLHDIAPTSLALLGIEIPPAMEGRVLQEAFFPPLPSPRGPTPQTTLDRDGQSVGSVLLGAQGG